MRQIGRPPSPGQGSEAAVTRLLFGQIGSGKSQLAVDLCDLLIDDGEAIGGGGDVVRSFVLLDGRIGFCAWRESSPMRPDSHCVAFCVASNLASS